ncbi:hypothetical protein IFM89_010548, partial [Coptis chinensis]
ESDDETSEKHVDFFEEDDTSDDESVASFGSCIDNEELIEVRKRIIELRKYKNKVDNDVNNEAEDNDVNGETLVDNEIGDDDYDSPEEDEFNVEADIRRKKDRFSLFNPKIDVKLQKPELGMKFESIEELKECIRNYAVCNGRPIWFKNNEASRFIEARCAENSIWKLSASYMQGVETVQVKTYIKQHTCEVGHNMKGCKKEFVPTPPHNKERVIGKKRTNSNAKRQHQAGDAT